MEPKINVSESDLYALREFMISSLPVINSDYATTAELRLKDHYRITYVNEAKDGSLFFTLKRCNKIFSDYDVLCFRYKGQNIEIQKEDIKDEKDSKQIKELSELLNKRCYRYIISNLDDLKE